MTFVGLTMLAPTITQIRAPDLKYVITDLTDVLLETVNSGSPLGFLAPISRDMACDYWISLLPELNPQNRILLVAINEEQHVVGSGQLCLSQRQNGLHRAELQKLFVARAEMGKGIGTSLVLALHQAARKCRRTLITLGTRSGEPPERFYKSLGYKEAGVIPGWSMTRDGQRYDHVTLYQELAP